ncbi:MAG: undecaprenyl-diphosphate phosphatase [Spirochaetia bacterium]
MTYGESLLLGALQGITEFLPISSSGHLALMRNVMELDNIPLLFDVVLHVATLFVVLLVFRDRIGRILYALGRTCTGKKDAEDRENLRLLGILLVSTVITAAFGLGLQQLEWFGSVNTVSLLFIVTGVLLITTRYARGNVGYGTLEIRHGVLVGIAQGFGVLPGISRAGATISVALLSGMSREKAGEYSFLISIPAVAGALLLELKDVEALFSSVSPLVMAAGFTGSFVVGLASLLLLLSLVRRGRLYLFSIYLIPLGIAGLILL